MLLLASLCMLVGSSLGAAVGMMPPKDGMAGGDMMMNDTMPKMCCMPKQWQGTVTDLKAQGGIMYASLFAHDAMTKREGYYVTQINSDKPIMQVFMDYVDKTTYTVNMSSPDPKDHKCYQTKNEQHFYTSCSVSNGKLDGVPVSNMHYIGDSRIGPESSAIDYDGWSFRLGDMDIIISLTRDGCVPLLENVKSVPGTLPMVDMLLMYTDVSPVIKNKELLTIPAACVNAASAVIG